MFTPQPLKLSSLANRLARKTAKYLLALLGIEKFRKKLRIAAIHRENNITFADFQHKYSAKRINTNYAQAINAPSSQWNEYDYAVTGSDQVWHNWSGTHEELEYYYLSFMPPEKRVSYAPSFGFTEFPERDYEIHKKGLAGFERLSCREQEMIPMIERISGKTAQLVLDPTLLLDASQWREYSAKPSYDVPEKYILCYFLGNKTPEYMAAIREAAGGLPVISMLDPDDEQHMLTDPAGLLWLIDHADFVCTDSFHGTAFSVNFGKNFLVFIRKGAEKMFGRISGLLDSLNITGHIYEPAMHIRPETVNYDDAYFRLEALRESSMQYLRECLK